MNICFFISNAALPNAGGIARITRTLVNLFREHGHQVYLMSEKKLCEVDNDMYDVNQHILSGSIQSSKTLNDFISFIHENNIELIVNQSSLSPIVNEFLFRVKRISQIKLISCIHNCTLTPILNYAYQLEFVLKKHRMGIVFCILKAPIVKKMMAFLYKLKYKTLCQNLLDYSDNVFVLCDGLKKEFEYVASKKNSEKIRVVPNCLPTPIKFDENKKNSVLWVASVDIRVKRIDFALKVWNKIAPKFPEWNFKILGDGPDLQQALQIKKELGIDRVSFEGRINPYEYFNEAKIILVTSTHESFSLVILEALQRNVVPVVVDCFPAASMLVKNDYNGILVEDFDEKKFSEALEKLMRNSQKISDLASRGPCSAEKFSPDNVYTKYWKEYLS